MPLMVDVRQTGGGPVDATVIPAFARPDWREKRKKKDEKPATLRHSSDPDADWYHRNYQASPGKEPETKTSIWGYEATLVVSGTDDPEEPTTMPSLVMGMPPLHKPARTP